VVRVFNHGPCGLALACIVARDDPEYGPYKNDRHNDQHEFEAPGLLRPRLSLWEREKFLVILGRVVLVPALGQLLEIH
jgi:hypothetical protein